MSSTNPYSSMSRSHDHEAQQCRPHIFSPTPSESPSHPRFPSNFATITPRTSLIMQKAPAVSEKRSTAASSITSAASSARAVLGMTSSGRIRKPTAKAMAAMANTVGQKVSAAVQARRRQRTPTPMFANRLTIASSPGSNPLLGRGYAHFNINSAPKTQPVAVPPYSSPPLSIKDPARRSATPLIPGSPAEETPFRSQQPKPIRTKTSCPPPSLLEQYCAIQPPVGQGQILALESGLSFTAVETPTSRVHRPHLILADQNNFRFVKALREVWLTLLHQNSAEDQLFRPDLDTFGADGYLAGFEGREAASYDILAAFNTAEQEFRRYWSDVRWPSSPWGGKPPPALDGMWSQFQKAMMHPPGTAMVEGMVKYINWPLFAVSHLNSPGRRWCEDRWPGFGKAYAKVILWQEFQGVLEDEFEKLQHVGKLPKLNLAGDFGYNGLEKVRWEVEHELMTADELKELGWSI